MAANFSLAEFSYFTTPLPIAPYLERDYSTSQEQVNMNGLEMIQPCRTDQNQLLLCCLCVLDPTSYHPTTLYLYTFFVTRSLTLFA